MSAALADAVMARIRGGQDAQQAVHKIRQGCNHGEVLLEALQGVLAADDAERLAGFCRELEKAVERAA